MSYSDLSLSFNQHPITKELLVLKDVAAVKHALKNILLLEYGDKPFNQNIFGGLRQYLFENPTPELIGVLKRNIKSTLSTFEPRANILDVLVYSLVDSNTLEIEVIFTVINFPTKETLNLSLERIR